MGDVQDPLSQMPKLIDMKAATVTELLSPP